MASKGPFTPKNAKDKYNDNCISIHANSFVICRFTVYLFFNCLHTKSLLVTQFLKADTQTTEPHTKSAKPYTKSQPLTQFSIS